jgi:hypothetical protein
MLRDFFGIARAYKKLPPHKDFGLHVKQSKAGPIEFMERLGLFKKP